MGILGKPKEGILEEDGERGLDMLLAVLTNFGNLVREKKIATA